MTLYFAWRFTAAINSEARGKYIATLSDLSKHTSRNGTNRRSVTLLSIFKGFPIQKGYYSKRNFLINFQRQYFELHLKFFVIFWLTLHLCTFGNTIKLITRLHKYFSSLKCSMLLLNAWMFFGQLMFNLLRKRIFAQGIRWFDDKLLRWQFCETRFTPLHLWSVIWQSSLTSKCARISPSCEGRSLRHLSLSGEYLTFFVLVWCHNDENFYFGYNDTFYKQ